MQALTGGDPITARFMRQDFFTFTPQFKLLIAGNHKLELRSVDEAIRRRFHLLPFVVTIPREQRGANLFEQLKLEWPAILRWAIDGCLEWQEQGLNAPTAVIGATAEYFSDEDNTGQWLAECCTPDELWFETTSDLYASWNGCTARRPDPRHREAPRDCAQTTRVSARPATRVRLEKDGLYRHPVAQKGLYR